MERGSKSKKAWLYAIGALIFGLAIGGVASEPAAQTESQVNVTQTQSIQIETPPKVEKLENQSATPTRTQPNTTRSSGLSNDNYYTNTAGNKVHSPAYSDSIPAGASAQCRDGTYSFSQSRRGTCSHHGGVAEWL